MNAQNRVALATRQRALAAVLERIEAEAKREGRDLTTEEIAQSDGLAAALATLTRQINRGNDVTASAGNADVQYRGHAQARGPPSGDGESFLRWREVANRTGLSRASIWRLVRVNAFPRPIPLLGPHSVGWLLSEVDHWIASRIALRDQRESRSVPKSPGRPRKVAAATTTQQDA